MIQPERNEIKRPTETEGVIFLLYKGGRVLVEGRLKKGSGFYGHTVIPGGEIEKGETPENAMKREIKEELDVVVKDFEELDTFESVTLNFGYHVFHAYLVTRFDGEIKNMEPEKSHFHWVSVPEAWDILKLASSRYVLCLAEKFTG